MKAIIDMGSQSIRLLKFFSMEDLLKGQIVSEICPLAKDLQDGYLNPKRKSQALALVKDFIGGLNPQDVYLYATSAMREARDGQEFLKELRGLGINAEIISGDEEARLGHLGVRLLAGEGDFALLDLGGGSTEIVLEGKRISYPMGVVRYKEDTKLDEYFSRLTRIKFPLYGIGGSLGVLASLSQGINYYSREKINGKILTRETIVKLTGKMKAMDLDERRDYLGEFRERVNTIVPAGIILDFILEELDCPLIYCDYTALEAYAIDRELI